MAKIEAPFTPEQVEKLKIWQVGKIILPTDEGKLTIEIPTHPFTCCSHDGCNRTERKDQGILIPTVGGWICPCGKYKQDWCHDFMVK